MRRNEHGELELTPHLVFRHEGFVQVGGEKPFDLAFIHSMRLFCGQNLLFRQTIQLIFHAVRRTGGVKVAELHEQVVCCADLGRRQLFFSLLEQRRAQLHLLPRRRCLLGGLVCAVAAADTGGGQLARQIRKVGMRVVEVRLHGIVAGLPVLELQDFGLLRLQVVRIIHLERKRVIIRAVLGHLRRILLAEGTRTRMPQQRCQNPRKRRACRTHGVLRQLVERCQQRPFFQRIPQTAGGCRQNQFFLGARHRYI